MVVMLLFWVVNFENDRPSKHLCRLSVVHVQTPAHRYVCSQWSSMPTIPRNSTHGPVTWEGGLGHGDVFQLSIYTALGIAARGPQGQLPLIMTLGMI